MKMLEKFINGNLVIECTSIEDEKTLFNFCKEENIRNSISYKTKEYRKVGYRCHDNGLLTWNFIEYYRNNCTYEIISLKDFMEEVSSKEMASEKGIPNVYYYKEEILARSKEKGINILHAIASLYTEINDVRTATSDEILEWLVKEHEEDIEMTQFEYDLIKLKKKYIRSFNCSDDLKKMKKKGYFKNIADTSLDLKEILERAKIID